MLKKASQNDIMISARMKKDVNMRYIGSKSLLLKEIDEFLTPNLDGNEDVFLDLFGGTNIVANYFKNRYRVFSNDYLYFSFAHAKATVESNGNLDFEGLAKKGIKNAITYLEEGASRYLTKGIVGYYEASYSPTGGSMYFTVENAKKIDYIREKIETWKVEKTINQEEYFHLLTVLINAIPFVSNITGTYGAYLKHWDKRALKPLQLRPIIVENNSKNNKAFNMDSNKLAQKISADIAYIDTPYNNRQYASNYHVLENIAKNEKPPLKGVTKIFDWKELRSDYSVKKNAYNAMEDLIKTINSNHIIISYSSDGIVKESEFIELLTKYAYNKEVKVKKINYKKYQSKVKSQSDELYELLFYFRKNIPNERKALPSKWKSSKTWNLEPKFIKSPLNYIGGKYKLLNQILPYFPKNIDTFFDVFSGGCNVGVNVTAKRYVFNDMNFRINDLFRFLQGKNPNVVISMIEEKIKKYSLSKTNLEGYLALRSDYNENPNPLDLYVLVSYSYNYQIRFNNNMEFNNPFGKDRSHFSENMKNNLRNFMLKLNEINVKFSSRFFEELEYSKLNFNDFVYFDPPYLITTGNYNDGNRGFRNWDEGEELKLYELMNQLTHQGVRWAFSNVLLHKGKENKYLQDFINMRGYNVEYLDYNYNNSSYNSKAKGSVEVLITNYCTQSFKLFDSD